MGGRLEQHIHFWLGAECSQDEAAVAAYKTVELDEFLDGAPIQHREVQGHESSRFLAYFKEGVRWGKIRVVSYCSQWFYEVSSDWLQDSTRRRGEWNEPRD